MKLEKIKRNHILQAAKYIDLNGIPENNIWSNYWVQVSETQEYPFKYLVQVANKFVPNNELLNFQSNKTYRNYMTKQLGFKIEKYLEGINFFKALELAHFAKLANTEYRRGNEEDARRGIFLKNITKKLGKWAELSTTENLIVKGTNSWQHSGRFLKYFWRQVYRKGDSGKVFFNFIVTGREIFCKIDCLGEDKSNLKAFSPKMQEYFHNYLNQTDHQPQIITKTQLDNYSWDKLIEETQTFIQRYLGLYDELESLVTNQNLENPDLQSNTLNQTTAPDQIHSRQSKKRNFKGADIDWFKKQRTSTHLGKTGEQLVIKIEKAKLIEWGMDKKADQVKKVKDGRGFDILSFDKNGSEIHIEVKTTQGKKEEPFYLSANEKAYMEEEGTQKDYRLYRLYNFNLSLNTGEFYVLTAKELQKMTFTPTNYEVSFVEEKK